jgi:Predicted pyridoxal phosphate-dependent enzyme apparently involved in regulation of cell wall biogenesis
MSEGRRTQHLAPSVPGWPKFDEDEIQAVEAVLRSGKVNYWTGEQARLFEREYAAHTGTQYGIALANGTVSLELALAQIGVGPGDEVITTPRSFVASANCIVLRGARPIFADVDLNSQNITAASIERVLTPATKAIICVHLGGWPCEMDAIMELAQARGIAVIEDCAQAHGARFKGRPVGGWGTFGSFSFCQDKIITTGGEGGMLVTNDYAAWQWCWSYKDHGKSYDAVYHRSHGVGFRWLHESFGTNWRMTEVQAAIGRLQLQKLSRWVEARRRNAGILIDELQNLDAVRVPVPEGECYHSYYRFYLFVRPEALRNGWSRDRIVAEVSARGVPCLTGSCSEIYLEKAYRDAGLAPRQRLPNARVLGDTSIAMLVHPTLSTDDMMRAADALKAVLALAQR